MGYNVQHSLTNKATREKVHNPPDKVTHQATREKEHNCPVKVWVTGLGIRSFTLVTLVTLSLLSLF